MRKIVLRVKDIENTNYTEVEKLVNERGIAFDGILISVGTGIAYLWITVRNVPVEPMKA